MFWNKKENQIEPSPIEQPVEKHGPCTDESPCLDCEIEKMSEQNRKDSLAEINKRGWCIQQAVYMDDCSPSNIISVAERIYKWVYGHAPEENHGD
jgi:hypothetical protein